MKRGKGKGKKHTANTTLDDSGSGEEEKPYQKRGRLQKPLKDETEKEEEVEKTEGDHGKNANGSIPSKDVKKQAAKESARKRKRPSKAKENTVKEENEVITKSNHDDSVTTIGFRQNGNRRKSTPRRAAEVGVECY